MHAAFAWAWIYVLPSGLRAWGQFCVRTPLHPHPDSAASRFSFASSSCIRLGAFVPLVPSAPSDVWRLKVSGKLGGGSGCVSADVLLLRALSVGLHPLLPPVQGGCGRPSGWGDLSFRSVLLLWCPISLPGPSFDAARAIPSLRPLACVLGRFNFLVASDSGRGCTLSAPHCGWWILGVRRFSVLGLLLANFGPCSADGSVLLPTIPFLAPIILPLLSVCGPPGVHTWTEAPPLPRFGVGSHALLLLASPPAWHGLGFFDSSRFACVRDSRVQAACSALNVSAPLLR